MEACDKRLKVGGFGKRDTTSWILANFNSICAEGAVYVEDREMGGLDFLFKSEPSILAVESFL